MSDVIINEIKSSKAPVAMEVPLLFESHLDDFADEIIYVDCSIEQRKQRLAKRDAHFNENLLINKDYDLKNKKKATHVINNDEGIAKLEKQIRAIFYK